MPNLKATTILLMLAAALRALLWPAGVFAEASAAIRTATPTGIGSATRSPDGLWQAVTAPSTKAQSLRLTGSRQPGSRFKLDREQCARLLASCPVEFSAEARQHPTVIWLPLPDGVFARFAVVASPILAPELAAKFHELTTYSGQGVDNPELAVRLDLSTAGLHAQVLTPSQTIYVEPGASDVNSLYNSYSDVFRGADAGHQEQCLHADLDEVKRLSAVRPLSRTNPGEPVAEVDLSTGPTLRTYRLAIATTGEWTALHGGTTSSAMAAIVTLINRVNGIYERECALRFQLVDGTERLIYTDAATDPTQNSK